MISFRDCWGVRVHLEHHDMRPTIPTLIPGLDRLFAQHFPGPAWTGKDSLGESQVEDFGLADGEKPMSGKTRCEGIYAPDQGKLQISLSGPAGTGKSVLAMHMAAGFRERHKDSIVIYVSTDLSYRVARAQFDGFGLSRPWKWKSPEQKGRSERADTEQPECRIELEEIMWDKLTLDAHATSSPALALPTNRYDTKKNEEEHLIFFVDLQCSASGDDWTYLEEFFSESLPIMGCDGHRQVLVVIDAIEGLDSPVTEHGFVSIRHRRRQRLAQLLESTSRHAHVVFTLETPTSNEKAEEEFVADISIRLDRINVSDTRRLTLEVVKARGMFSHMGVHHLEVRDGDGTTSFTQSNIDDPSMARNYVLLVPSLSTVQERMERSIAEDNRARNAGQLSFGIRDLDNMLSPSSGLQGGRVHAIIGEENTNKSRLAYSFISQALASLTYLSKHSDHKSVTEWFFPAADLKIESKAYNIRLKNVRTAVTAGDLDQLCNTVSQQEGIAVLFKTGRAIDSDGALRAFLDFANDPDFDLQLDEVDKTEQLVKMNKFLAREARNDLRREPRRFFYRRLPTRPISAEQFYYIAQQTIKAAIREQILFDHRLMRRALALSGSSVTISAIKHVRERCKQEIANMEKNFPDWPAYKNAWKVRVVFDDLNVMLSTFGLDSDEGTIVPCLIDLCRLTGVTALFVDSQPGGPLEVARSSYGKYLRAQADTVIYTWNVAYAGGTKVAIAAIPPISSEEPVVVRELSKLSPENERLDVDRCLELYLDVMPSQGNQHAELNRVPLRFLMATDSQLWRDSAYESRCRETLTSYFSPSEDLAAAGLSTFVSVASVSRKELEAYVNYNTIATEQATVVSMVDEFWTPEQQRSSWGKPRVNRYHKLDQDMVDDLWNRADVKVLQGSRFLSDYESGRSIRVAPFTWNTGLLLVRRNSWEVPHINVPTKSVDQYGRRTIANCRSIAASERRAVREAIVRRIGEIDRYMDFCVYRDHKVGDDEDPIKLIRSRRSGNYHWHEFLSTCSDVAETVSVRYDRTKLVPYDLDLVDEQSLSCLLLEIWFSTAVWLRMVRSAESEADSETKDVRRAAKQVLGLFGCPSGGDDRPVHGHVMSISEVLRDGLDQLNRLKQSHKMGTWPVKPDPDRLLTVELTLGLYFTLSMLAESVDFSAWQLDDATFLFKPQETKGGAVAGRYWYTTACSMLNSADADSRFDPDDPLLPFPLPGYFATRGDWGLAVLTSSRSRYLGQQVINSLCQATSSAQRMQMGAGLPVLRMFGVDVSGNPYREMRTSLPCPKGGRLVTFPYDYIRAISPLEEGVGYELMFPIFRSGIKDYLSEHDGFLQGMCRCLSRLEEVQREKRTKWVDFHTLMCFFKGQRLSDSFAQKIGEQIFYDFSSWTFFSEFLSSYEPLIGVSSLGHSRQSK